MANTSQKIAKAISGAVGLAVVVAMVPFAALAQTVVTVTPTTTSASCPVFTKTLKQGVTNMEVKTLQQVLNADAATAVATTGVGSAGYETSYFGAMTKSAVVRFQNKYASEVLAPAGLTQGSGIVAGYTRAKLNSLCGSTGSTTTTGGTTTTTGTTVTASLDASSPVMGSLIPGQSLATLAVYKLTNPTSAPVKVTGVKMTRTGISSDATLSNVYLYNGAARVTDSATVASGVINFTNTAGIVTVPAGSSVSLAVRADIASGTTGQTIGVNLTTVSLDNGTTAGLPVAGGYASIAAVPSGMTSFAFNAVTTPNSSGSIDPQTDFVLWQNTATVGSRDGALASIRFRQIGSVNASDLSNFRLIVDGVQVGQVSSVDSAGYVTFTFASPISLRAGSRTMKLVGDIVGGSSRTFQFSVQQASDIEVRDSQLGVAVAATTVPATAASQTINQGVLTITKATDSPSGNTALGASAVTFAKFNLKANGERLKIENLKVNFSSSDGTITNLRNGAVFANGVQIGSTADITTAGYQYNLGSSLIIEPGQTVALEVRGDVVENASTNHVTAGDTLTVGLVIGSSNVYKMQSYGYINSPAATANTLTVAAGSLTSSKYSAYADQTVVVPQTAFKIGEFRVLAGDTENLTLDTITVSLTGTATMTNLSNLYVVYGSKTSTMKATGAASQTWSINEPLTMNATMPVAVYADLSSAITSGQTVIPALVVSGTAQTSGNAVTASSVTGQTMTAGTATIAAAVDASTPVAMNVVQNSMPKVASYKFTTTNDAMTITKLVASVASSTAVSELVIRDGATEVARVPLSGNTATAAGLSVAVPANSSKVLDVYANVGTIGVGAALTQSNLKTTLTSYDYRTSSGVNMPNNSVTLAGNAIYAFKTRPTIANVALPTTVLNAGTQTIAKVSVTADAGGVVHWDKIAFNVGLSSGTTVATPALYDDANQTTAIGSCSGTTTITCTGVNQEVSGTKTYVLKATVGGTVTTGSSVSTSILSSGLGIATPAAASTVAGTAATFVWSDESASAHTTSTLDWMNDYLVKNLPTDSQTMSK